MTEGEIFSAALTKKNPGERAAFLNEKCEGDLPLRQRVESLLAEHQQLGSFMDGTFPAATLELLPEVLPIADAHSIGIQLAADRVALGETIVISAGPLEGAVGTVIRRLCPRTFLVSLVGASGVKVRIPETLLSSLGRPGA